MNTPSDTHVIQARDLIEMLREYPDFGRVALDFDQGRAFIDHAEWHNGQIELKCLFERELKTQREEELEGELVDFQSENSKMRDLLERFDSIAKRDGLRSELVTEVRDFLKE